MCASEVTWRDARTHFWQGCHLRGEETKGHCLRAFRWCSWILSDTQSAEKGDQKKNDVRPDWAKSLGRAKHDGSVK